MALHNANCGESEINEHFLVCLSNRPMALHNAN